jgi:hypothetical protein
MLSETRVVIARFVRTFRIELKTTFFGPKLCSRFSVVKYKLSHFRDHMQKYADTHCSTAGDMIDPRFYVRIGI